MKAAVIIPAFNEEEALSNLIPEFYATAWPEGYEVEAVVVNDASLDHTVETARRLGATVIDLPVNLGIGGAMQTGFIYAFEQGFDMAIQMDGDGQHPPSEIAKLISNHQSADVLIGSRFLSEKSFRSSFMRRVGIRYFNFVIRLLTRVHITDSTSGMRLMNRKALEICASNYPDEYPEPESIVVLANSGLRISEIPVLMREREHGRSSIRALISVYYMLKVSVAMTLSYLRTKGKRNG